VAFNTFIFFSTEGRDHFESKIPAPLLVGGISMQVSRQHKKNKKIKITNKFQFSDS
jgi:hypothetical protein